MLTTNRLLSTDSRPTFVRRFGRGGDPIPTRRRQHGGGDAVVAETSDGVRVPLILRLRDDGSRLPQQRPVLVLEESLL